MNLTDKLLAAFLNNLAMSEGIQMIGMFEGKGTGINFSNWTSGLSVDDDFSLFQIMTIMVIDNFIHLILLYYFEKILPGDHGIAEPWNFPYKYLSSWLWSQKQQQDAFSINSEESFLSKQQTDYGSIDEPNIDYGLPVYIEDETAYQSRNIGIRINNLKKRFKQFGKSKIAVNNLSLNVYEGQITVLLGHNGAGKSTTISMITGLCKPDKGNILIDNIDVVKNTRQARSVLGYCPQHNLLFDDLTVYEHLKFFSQKL